MKRLYTTNLLSGYQKDGFRFDMLAGLTNSVNTVRNMRLIPPGADFGTCSICAAADITAVSFKYPLIDLAEILRTSLSGLLQTYIEIKYR